MNQDLKTALKLGAQNVLGVIARDRDYLPYWSMEFDDNGDVFSHMGWTCHNLGRWWDAVTRLEQVLPDFVVPPDVEAGMLNNAYRYFNQPDGLAFQPFEDPAWPQELELHSLREWALLLLALIRHRNSHWAKEAAHRMGETLERIFTEPEVLPEPGSGDTYQYWKISELEYFKVVKGEPKFNHGYPMNTFGRVLGPLCWLYEETKDEVLLRLANRFAEILYRDVFMPDGTVKDITPYCHMHSSCGTVQSLIVYGQVTKQRKYIERAAVAFEKYLMPYVKRSGFCNHAIFAYDAGDPASTCDMALIARWLVDEGYEQFADYPEHLLRSRVFAAQITEPFNPPLRAWEGKCGNDTSEILNQRCIGGFNIHLAAHGRKGNTTDVTCACMHALTDLYSNTVRHSATGLEIFLHFDFESDDLKMKVSYEEEACVRFVMKKTNAVKIRIPKWAEVLEITADGKPIETTAMGIWTRLGKLEEGTAVCVRYSLPEDTFDETLRNGETYTFKVRGDEVLGIKPNDCPRPFYPTLE